MEKSDFDLLLQRYLAGQVSEEERIKIEAWLDVVKTQPGDEFELSKSDEQRLFNKIKHNVLDAEIEALAPGKKNNTSKLGWMLRVAASILALTLVSYFGWYMGSFENGRLEIASKNSNKKVILEDGSVVWLRGQSKLVSYRNKTDGTRYSELTGEALFEVAKDPGHPFLIQCGDVQIKVLGTSFNVRARGDSLELKVLTGLVKLSLSNDDSVVARPNEKLLYASGQTIVRKSLNEREISAAISDTEYNMEFTNTNLQHVFDRLARKFDVDIQFDARQIGDCRITSDLTDRSLQKSLQLITEVLDVDYQQNGKTITVTGKGCK